MARKKDYETSTPKIFVENTDMKLKKDIINIARHIGIPYGQFLRMKIIEIRDSYPEDKRLPPLTN